MKFSILAVAAILSTGAHAQGDCEACPNGITVDPSTPTVQDNTCGGISAAAAEHSADSDTCAAIKEYESTCCGGVATTAAATTEAPASMCVACPNGVKADLASQVTTGDNTCATITADAAGFTADSTTCGRIQAFESKCCPDGGAATTAAATTEAPKTTAAATTEAPKTTADATTEATAAPDTTVSTEQTTTTSSTAAAVGSTTSTAAPDASTTTSVPVASGFNAIYNDSAGHSFSAKNGFTLTSFVVCVVSAMFM